VKLKLRGRIKTFLPVILGQLEEEKEAATQEEEVITKE